MKKTKYDKSILRSWDKACRRWKCTNSFQLIDYTKPTPWSDNRVYRPSIELLAPYLLRSRKMYPRGQRIVAHRRYKRKRGL